MDEQKIGKVIVDSRAEMTFDRETDYRIYSKTFPLKKYVIEKGQGFIRAIRKGKKVAKELLVSATPAQGKSDIMTLSKGKGETYHLFDSEGKWLFFSAYYDGKGRVIGFRAWLGDLDQI